MEKEKNPYTYVIVRTDIPLVQQLVQAAHATHYAGFRFQEPDKISYLILLQIENEYELFQAYRYIAMQGIKVAAFFEPDANLGLTAIATEPLYNKEDRSHFFKWEMWKPPTNSPFK